MQFSDVCGHFRGEFIRQYKRKIRDTTYHLPFLSEPYAHRRHCIFACCYLTSPGTVLTQRLRRKAFTKGDESHFALSSASIGAGLKKGSILPFSQFSSTRFPLSFIFLLSITMLQQWDKSSLFLGNILMISL